jgi:hypothetical protein
MYPIASKFFKHTMPPFEDIDDLREKFAIESANIITGLDQMIERTKKLENLIRLLGPVKEQGGITDDVYKPLPDVADAPPKKKMRIE